MKATLDIGIPVQTPTATCNDRHCPFHGSAKLRGRIFSGTVVKDIFHSTATIEFNRQIYLPKYERYETRRTRLKAHVPPCVPVAKGNVIKVMESKPISKTKNFIAVEVLKP